MELIISILISDTNLSPPVRYKSFGFGLRILALILEPLLFNRCLSKTAHSSVPGQVFWKQVRELLQFPSS